MTHDDATPPDTGPSAEVSVKEEKAWELIRYQLGEPVVACLEDEDCTEIMANPDGSIWVETHSKGMFRTDITLGAAKRRQIIQTVASAAHKVCHKDEPSIGDVLPVVGARFQGLIEPASPAPVFTIRLPSSRIVPLIEYVDSGALGDPQFEEIFYAVPLRKNILVAGGTGSGKTTFANAVLRLMGEIDHRILMIEDTSELRCPAPNTITMQVSRQGSFQYHHALFAALRMRPDRIIVGELRDGLAALELLKAWNTGHNGGLATLHSNSSEATLSRLEQLLEEELPHAPRSLIAEAVDLVVFLERYTDPEGQSRRRVREVTRVGDTLDEQGEYVLEYLWHPSA